jgi:hypothetical protein
MTDQGEPGRDAWTWATACDCGTRYCRSGWPENAPLPAELPNPRQYLSERLAEIAGFPAGPGAQMEAGQ